MKLPNHITLNYFSGRGYQPVQVLVNDGRKAGATLNQFGFELISHRSGVQDWFSQQEVNAKHYGEIVALAKQLTGCDFVLFYPALLRNPEATKVSEDFHPIQGVHSDYTESYSTMIQDPGHPYHKVISQFMPAAGVTSADVVGASRIRTLQFWRNIGPAEVDYPLAICDTRTVSRDELISIMVETYGGLLTRFESFLVRGDKAEKHGWYTFPDLRADELLMFLAFDSDKAKLGERFWTPHAAFLNPDADEATPARESIEMRAICFWH